MNQKKNFPTPTIQVEHCMGISSFRICESAEGSGEKSTTKPMVPAYLRKLANGNIF